MPPASDLSLDVALSRAGQCQRWRIEQTKPGGGCRFEYAGVTRFASGDLLDVAATLRKRLEYEAEIAAALADGWSRAT
jgi:hypothetical protein